MPLVALHLILVWTRPRLQGLQFKPRCRSFVLSAVLHTASCRMQDFKWFLRSSLAQRGTVAAPQEVESTSTRQVHTCFGVGSPPSCKMCVDVFPRPGIKHGDAGSHCHRMFSCLFFRGTSRFSRCFCQKVLFSMWSLCIRVSVTVVIFIFILSCIIIIIIIIFTRTQARAPTHVSTHTNTHSRTFFQNF